MEKEQFAAASVLPVRPVPSLKPRDPAVDDPDYILMSKSRLDDLIDFLIKNKARFFFSHPSPLSSPLAPPTPFPSHIFLLFSPISYFSLFASRNSRLVALLDPFFLSSRCSRFSVLLPFSSLLPFYVFYFSFFSSEIVYFICLHSLFYSCFHSIFLSDKQQ